MREGLRYRVLEWFSRSPAAPLGIALSLLGIVSLLVLPLARTGSEEARGLSLTVSIAQPLSELARLDSLTSGTSVRIGDISTARDGTVLVDMWAPSSSLVGILSDLASHYGPAVTSVQMYAPDTRNEVEALLYLAAEREKERELRGILASEAAVASPGRLESVLTDLLSTAEAAESMVAAPSVSKATLVLAPEREDTGLPLYAVLVAASVAAAGVAAGLRRRHARSPLAPPSPL